MKTKINAFLLLIAFCVFQVKAVNYYVKSNGNDNLAGTSIANAWKTIVPVNSINLQASDTVFLEGNSSFVGPLTLNAQDRGGDNRPVVITSYGIGRAIINSATDNGIYGFNAGGIKIENLEIVGPGTGSDKTGIYFYVDINSVAKLPTISIHEVEVRGFKTGIIIGNWNDNYLGYKTIRITHTKCHDNGTGGGIMIWDKAGTDIVQYAHDSLYMAHCEIYGNKASGGILCGIGRGTVEYCYVHDNEGNGGLNLWTYSVANITVQHCIFSNYRLTGGVDGGGFDFDGGSVNCVLQYCYMYNNDGMAAMICDYPNARPTKNNSIRYCLSENDCRKNTASSAFGYVNWGAGIEDSYIYNNTVYLEQVNGSTTGRSGLGTAIISSFVQKPLSNCKIANNVVYLNGDGLLFVANERSGKNFTEYQGNVYHSAKSASFRDGNSVFTSLLDWQRTGQEMWGTARTGLQANPLLRNPGTVGNLSDVNQLKNITAYSLTSNSPCLNRGLDLLQIYGIAMGKLDFTGKTIPVRGRYDCGAFQSDFVTGSELAEIAQKTTFTASPNPSSGIFYLNFRGSPEQTRIHVYTPTGNLIKTISTFHWPVELSIQDLADGIYFLKFEGSNHAETVKIIKRNNLP